MCLRISNPNRNGIAAAALLALAACNTPGDAPEMVQGEQIPCATAPDQKLTQTCIVQRETTADGLMLTLRQPQGGFHRLQVTQDGHGVIAADGAQPAQITITGDQQIDVAIGDARYRLPATIQAR